MTVEIEYGCTKGQYFTQWRFDRLTELANELAEFLPATNWRIWYDGYHDFHRLEFDLEGRHYTAQLYKVFALYKDGLCPSITYGRGTVYLKSFFKSGRYRTWEPAQDPHHSGHPHYTTFWEPKQQPTSREA